MKRNFVGSFRSLVLAAVATNALAPGSTARAVEWNTADAGAATAPAPRPAARAGEWNTASDNGSDTAPAPRATADGRQWGTADSAPAAEPADQAPPEFTADGRLNFPQDYREWVFLSSGLDMSYVEGADKPGHSMFDNVFAEPGAYREFLRSGTWPDGTVLVLENRVAAEKGSINRHGKFQTREVMGVEVHVKDTGRFPGGWAFFAFRNGEPARMIPMSADCYACHRQHAAVDTTFVQFYPTLLPIATMTGTLRNGSMDPAAGRGQPPSR